MGDELRWSYAQLETSYAELQVKDEREELKEDLQQIFNEAAATQIKIREHDHNIELIQGFCRKRG